MKRYKTPGGTASGLALNILNQPHVLIAGATGSGKSTLLNTVIYTALLFAPPEKQFILIDPKRVELIEYARLPHTITRATEPRQIAAALTGTVSLIEDRYKRLEKRRAKLYDGSDVYIIVDELADLLTVDKKTYLPLLQRIGQIGRAARVHLIAATQRPTKDILSGQLKVNLDARLALRTASKQDSRNIIERGGAELLPRFGQGLYMIPEFRQPERVTIPATPPECIAARVNYWMKQ